MGDSKVCSKCKLNKPLDQYYQVSKTSSEVRAACKKCFNVQENIYKSNRALKDALQRDPLLAFRRQTNEVALEMLAIELQKNLKAVLTADTHIQGALFALPRGLEMRMGGVGPVVTFQTSTKRIKKSLAMEPVAHIAAEMDRYGIVISLKGLKYPERNHPLRKVLRVLLRERKWASRERKYMRLPKEESDRGPSESLIMQETHENEGGE